MRSVDPATLEIVTDVEDHSSAQAAALLAAAAAAFPAWRDAGIPARAAVLRRAGALLRERRDALATLAVREMGKPIAQAEAEVEKCAAACEWFAEHAAAALAPETIASDATRSGVRNLPFGVVLAVMPWNFPFWQVVRAATPALAAGNTVALKHASNVPGVALAIEALFRDAGAPPGVFTTLLVGARDVPALIAHPAIAAVTLTGSEAAGREVAACAGRALKPCVLELGGSDPFVVLADADLDAVVPLAVTARVQNNGQSCIAAKRFIVVEPLADAFAERFARAMDALVVGDPLDRATQVGPLAKPEFVDDLEDQVRRSIAAGARLLVGGRRPPGLRGAFYAPTVLAEVRPGCPAFDEETFGPVAPVIRARDDAEALTLANHSRFGLGASVWTRDAARGEAFAARIEAGAVFVNGIVKSDPRLPFGGIKASGWGRELGVAGLRAFTNLQTHWAREA